MRYMTLAETIKANGERHLANAVGYAAKGLPDHSAGSQRKAERNFKRAEALEWPLDPFLDGVMATIRHAIDNAVMNGVSSLRKEK